MKTRRKSSGGWYGDRPLEYRAKVSQQHQKKWPGFVSPEGVSYGPVINLKAFCEDHDLDPSAMRMVALGGQKQHRGWTSLSVEPSVGFDTPVKPIPYQKDKGQSCLVKGDWESVIFPLKTRRDVLKAARLIGCDVEVIEGLLSGKVFEYQGWRIFWEVDAPMEEEG